MQALRGKQPTRVRVRGLRLMKGDPAAAHVLYAGVLDAPQVSDPAGCTDPDRDVEASVDTLQRMCAAVIRAFAAAGLIPHHDVRSILSPKKTAMHASQPHSSACSI